MIFLFVFLTMLVFASVVSELTDVVSAIGPSDARPPARGGDAPPQVPKDGNVPMLDPPTSGHAEVSLRFQKEPPSPQTGRGKRLDHCQW